MKIARLPNGSPEIFYSLQGEGIQVGCPSIFIRLSFCNLQCVWCDTEYTWNFEGTPWKHQNSEQPNYQKFKKEEVVMDLDVEGVCQEVKKYACHRLVLTGGEPLLQQESLIELLKRLGPQYSTEVETNGTIIPQAGFDVCVESYNVSPKLMHSGNRLELAQNEKALEWFSASQKSIFKFVVQNDQAQQSLREIKVLQERYRIDKKKILLMPEGQNSRELKKSLPLLAQICLEEGYRLSDRLHVHLYGNKRGV